MSPDTDTRVAPRRQALGLSTLVRAFPFVAVHATIVVRTVAIASHYYRWFPICWNDEGFYYVPIQPSRDIAFRGGVVDSLDTTDVRAIVVRWREAIAVAAVEPWPAIEIRSQFENVILRNYYGHADEFATGVAAFLQHVAAYRPDVVSRGWLDVPIASWESAAPPERVDTRQQGAFRTPAKSSDPDPILAIRSPNTVGENLIQWFVLTKDCRARSVIVTRSFVYAERTAGKWYRLPIEDLRCERNTDSGDAAFVFGRNTVLVLLKRESCPVVQALRERLQDSSR